MWFSQLKLYELNSVYRSIPKDPHGSPMLVNKSSVPGTPMSDVPGTPIQGTPIQGTPMSDAPMSDAPTPVAHEKMGDLTGLFEDLDMGDAEDDAESSDGRGTKRYKESMGTPKTTGRPPTPPTPLQSPPKSHNESSTSSTTSGAAPAASPSSFEELLKYIKIKEYVV